MEGIVIVAHVFFCLLLILNFLIKIIWSLWTFSSFEKQDKLRKKFRYPEWILFSFVIITGIYPILVLNTYDIYHLLKIVLLIGVVWFSRSLVQFNYTFASSISLLLFLIIGWVSFAKVPTFKTQQRFIEIKTEAELKGGLQEHPGKIIFDQLCSTCHGADGKLMKFQAADLSVTQLTLEERIDIIRNGSPLTVMAPFNRQLSEEEIEAVALYIEEMKTQ